MILSGYREGCFRLSQKIIYFFIKALLLPGAIGFSAVSAQENSLDVIPRDNGIPAEQGSRVSPIFRPDVEYTDKITGDKAFAAGDFAVAASFYRKYRERAERDENETARKKAFECEIDALIFAGLTDQAENVLNIFKRIYADANPSSLSIWEADILLNQRKLGEAQKILQNLLPKLNPGDPRRVRVLSSLAYVCELTQKYQEAADLYLTIAGENGE